MITSQVVSSARDAVTKSGMNVSPVMNLPLVSAARTVPYEEYVQAVEPDASESPADADGAPSYVRVVLISSRRF